MTDTSDTETLTIEVDQFLAHPPARVWRALVEPDLQARWMSMGPDFEPMVGHRFAIDMGEWGTTQCEVLEVVEAERLVISWANDPLATTVTWRLVPEGTGTRLFLEHAGFTPDQRGAVEGMGAGWGSAVRERLPEVLASIG
ncbi:MAG TPA: SRPBCC domain-containing protein [Iamia sp.]|nr:SRPBCC domain-containing protein [Iamia sp.]